MPPIKVTYFFEEGAGGWSESYYQNAINVDDPQLRINAPNLLIARFGIMSQRVSFLGSRFSDPTVFRDSRFHFPTSGDIYAGLQPFWNVQATELDTAVVNRIEAGPLNRRLNLLRGCPEFIVSDVDNSYVPFPAGAGAAWSTKINQWSLALQGANFAGINAGQWLLWSDDRTSANTPTLAANVTLVDNSNRYFNFTTGATAISRRIGGVGPLAAVGAGDGIVITGAGSSHGLNGKWTVSVVDTTLPLTIKYTVFPQRHLIALGQSLQPFRVRAQNYIGVGIDNSRDEKLAYRKTGRPFGLLRGRRRGGL